MKVPKSLKPILIELMHMSRNSDTVKNIQGIGSTQEVFKILQDSMQKYMPFINKFEIKGQSVIQDAQDSIEYDISLVDRDLIAPLLKIYRSSVMDEVILDIMME